MSADREHPDEVCVVYYRDGSTGYVDPVHEAEIDRAIDRYAGAGANRFTDSDDRDTVLRLRSLSGARMTVLASALWGCSVSTRETRRLKAIQDAAIDSDAAAGLLITEVPSADPAKTD